jgi:hypothetical protein
MKNSVDMVNKPPHYTKHKWEVIDILEEFFSDGQNDLVCSKTY